ncbi:PHP domain-containing protein [Natronomonas sp. EA1]|uniref:PHP domain-containing protein n=1 Tax=Natronomonas sp. EA1 TaxID=3421655 RepID=UPI003EBB7524
MRFDYHTHSNYSDGEFLGWMVRAAEQAGLEGIGFADHCNVSPREEDRTWTAAMGFNLDLTYERRRAGIERVRERYDIRVFDAVEMDYDPRDESEIGTFLDEVGFDYTIGSVHTLEDVNVHFERYFAKKSEAERRELVSEYFDKLVALVDSELFDIAAHPDLIERNPALRGFATDEQYHRVAKAFEESRTIPEINAGRVTRDYGEFHPSPAFMAVLSEYDIAFTLGSDAHEPEAIGERKEELEKFVALHGLETVEPVG